MSRKRVLSAEVKNDSRMEGILGEQVSACGKITNIEVHLQELSMIRKTLSYERSRMQSQKAWEEPLF